MFFVLFVFAFGWFSDVESVRLGRNVNLGDVLMCWVVNVGWCLEVSLFFAFRWNWDLGGILGSCFCFFGWSVAVHFWWGANI